MLRWAVAALLVCWPATAAAQPRFVLDWSAPVGCPTTADVDREIEKRLGASAPVDAAAVVTASARVVVARSGFELELYIGSKARTLRAPSCNELGHAAALVVALAVNPALDVSESDRVMAAPCPEPAEPAAAPAPQCPACPSCPKPPPPPPAPAPARRWGLLASVGVAYGELPQALPHASLGAQYRRDFHTFELSLGAAFASTGYRPDGRGGSFSQWYAAPRYCLQLRVSRLGLGGCALSELGTLKGSGFGVTAARTQRHAWIAPGAGFRASFPPSPGAALVLDIDLLFPILRPRFELEGERLFRPHAVVPAARLTLVGEIL